MGGKQKFHLVSLPETATRGVSSERCDWLIPLSILKGGFVISSDHTVVEFVTSHYINKYIIIMVYFGFINTCVFNQSYYYAIF